MNISTMQASTITCTSCGVGLVTGTEISDGSDLTGQTCKNQGGPTPKLSPACPVVVVSIRSVALFAAMASGEAEESCDTADFGGATCESLGYSGGSLQCDNECSEFFITLPCDEQSGLLGRDSHTIPP